MVRYILSVKAVLQNLTDFQPKDGLNSPEFSYTFKLECNACHEVSKKDVCMNLGDFSCKKYKCKFCKAKGSVTIDAGHGRPYTDIDSINGTFVPVMHFKCSNFEPVSFVSDGKWQAQTMDGVTREIDIDEDGYYQLDVLPDGSSASVYDVKFIFKRSHLPV